MAYWSRYPVSQLPTFPSARTHFLCLPLDYKVKPQPGRILCGMRRLITRAATLLQLFCYSCVALEPIIRHLKLPLTTLVRGQKLAYACSFIVHLWLFFFLRWLPSKDAQVLRIALIALFGIVIVSITYYYCSDDVLYPLHTWNFHINFCNINGTHTNSTHTHTHTNHKSHISCYIRYLECLPFGRIKATSYWHVTLRNSDYLFKNVRH